MPKTEVYSWRISPDLKAALEEAARAHRLAVSALLERVARRWLIEHARDAEEGEQDRLRTRAMAYVGRLRGGTGGRATDVRRRVRARLKKRRGR